jgi:histidine triad (HIT) family protein
MASIFSRIVAGDIPSAKVYEDEQTLAFLDVNPLSRGHTLVICKQEYPGLLEVPPDIVALVAQTTQRVARAIELALKPDGFNVLQNNGSAAGQVVFHYHVHIIPRWENDGGFHRLKQQRADPAELEHIAEQIRQQRLHGQCDNLS